MSITIKSNYQWREILHERDENNEDNEEEVDSYFIYKEQKFYLHEFIKITKSYPSEFQKYDGMTSLSAFSGILIKISECGEAVKVFYFYS